MQPREAEGGRGQVVVGKLKNAGRAPSSNAGLVALSLPIEVLCRSSADTSASAATCEGVAAGVRGGDSTLAWVCDMNATALLLGLTRTHFENPHG